jgi:protein PET100
MAGPNLELFKFSLYLFFPLAIMVHYGDPQWYHDNVLPFRDRFWPEEESLYVGRKRCQSVSNCIICLPSLPQQKPPRNPADLKAEMAELRALRLTNKERREQGLPPLPPPVRTNTRTTTTTSAAAINSIAEDECRPSLRQGSSLGTLGMREAAPAATLPAQRARTWRETWQEATERHVV